jgi:aerobic carbon-monoxide dehydrogenase medium subunit
MYSFEYQKPTDVKSAVQAASASGENKFIAGGMTLLPTLKLRLARPDSLVDLGRIAELAGIRIEANRVEIGAMTRHADVAHSAELRRALPALAIRWCATAAPSAVRSPTTTRRRITRRPCSASAAR